MAKYLKIKIVGHEAVFANENQEKSDDRHPDYVGDGVMVWVNEREAL